MTIVKHKPVFINNLFDEIFNNLPSQTERNGFSTAVNIHETAEGFHIELNAPARSKEDFKISADKGLLTISYEKNEGVEQKGYKTLRREFSVNSFKRTFNLEDNINVDAIQAKYENGVLTVFLPKKDEAKVQPKEINIL